MNLRVVERLFRHRNLAFDTWRGIARLQIAVIINRPAFQYRIDMVAITQCVTQALQYDNAGSATEYGAIGTRIKSITTPIRGLHSALHVLVATAFRGIEGNATGDYQIAFPIQQTINTHHHGDHRGRTRRLHINAGPF